MSDDKLEEIAGAFFPESAERFSRCRAAVGRAYDLGRAEEAAEWAEEVKAEARDCGCWERILRRRGEGEK